MKDTEKGTGQHVEMVQDSASEAQDIGEAANVMGTVKLTEGSIIYIPTPTADPQGMLSKFQWEKMIIVDFNWKTLSTCLFGKRRLFCLWFRLVSQPDSIKTKLTKSFRCKI